MKRANTLSGLLLLLVGFCGCTQQVQPPTEFAQLVSQADRIVVTNRYRPVTFTITGEEFTRVGKAVVSAKHNKKSYASVFDWHVQFFSGTNFLTVIHFQGRLFLAGGTQYSDDTGVLRNFYLRLERDWRDARTR